MRTYTFDDLINAFVRRRWTVLIPFALGLAVAPVLARFAPERYRSETLIMVVPQRVPDEYVKATVTANIEDRLPSITEQILSRSRLELIINELGLYKERRGRQVMEDIVQKMRNDDVTVEVVGEKREAADSFRIGYVSDSAETARKVTERLASLVIEQNLKDRENQAESTSQFLSSQLQEAKQRLVEQEKRLEEYRRQHSGELPTQLQGNLQSIQNTNLQLQALHESMNRAQERRLLIERQIADAETMPLPTMPGIGVDTAAPATTRQRLEAAKARLTTALQFYTADHPEVVTLQRLISELQSRADSEVAVSDTSLAEQGLSPLEIQQRKRILDLKAELLVVDKQLETSRATEAQLRGTISSLQSKVDALPSRESELVELTRDYSTLQTAYGNLLMKREDSVIAADLERRQIGEQFRILDPASMPERPYNQMRRLLIVASGAIGGLLLGLVAVLFLELRDSSFRREEDVMAKLSLPVLALIPIMSSDRERQSASRHQRWLDVAGIAALVLAVGVVVLWRLQS